jgi:WD40 repeat protein
LLFEPDGSRLFSADRDGLVQISDPKTGETYGVLRGHDDYVMSLAMSGDGKRLVSGSGDGTVRIWDTTLPRARGREREQ